ncbi:MAG TPA: o-succinylbenzoate synthase [Glaciihabitans sp.]|jgi:O-succinylbenzoate synthase|nr:o-succinylbenzoate synthase [Glaciihabitans sp.]
MKVTAIELHRLAMPLVRPFETSIARHSARDLLLVHVLTDTSDGWGECIAPADPIYSSEYVAGVDQVLREYLVPALLDAPTTPAEDFSNLVASVRGHPMAKAALETALLDAQLRDTGTSFAQYFGGVRNQVDCGVAVGIAAGITELLDEVNEYVEAGYRRVSLKIQPGWDIGPVAAVRDLVGDDVLLQVDAQMAYSAADIRLLAELDAFDLVLIEQPFSEDDVPAHILLAQTIETPVCLDESVVNATVAVDLIERGATSIVDIKAGRMGGYLEAVRAHDVCAELGVSVWCGGMLETGIGRSANLALSAMENFLLPADAGVPGRYFAEDLTETVEMVDGRLDVPTGPGCGAQVRQELVRDWALGRPLVLHAG